MPSLITKAALVYGGAFLIGLVLVSFPASSSFLKITHGFSDQQYGAIFLPQLVLAILGALGAGIAVQKMRPKSMYLYALFAFALSQLSLSMSLFMAAQQALLLIMFATACFGFGFGFGGGPLNGLVCLLFPNKTGTALTAFHMIAGLGLMSGPLFFRWFIEAEQWVWAPMILTGFALLLLLLVLCINLPGEALKKLSKGSPLPYDSVYFWLMVLIAILYAFSEGTFSNWAIIYISETRELPATVAASALSAFWGGLTLGRLLVSFVLLKFKPTMVWVALTLMMVPAFILVAKAFTPGQAIAAYAFAGLACSAFFPLMLAVAAEPYPEAVSWIASMLTAALMLGVGTGSYAIGVLKSVVTLEQIYFYSCVYPILTLVMIVLSIQLLKSRQID